MSYLAVGAIGVVWLLLVGVDSMNGSVWFNLLPIGFTIKREDHPDLFTLAVGLEALLGIGAIAYAVIGALIH